MAGLLTAGKFLESAGERFLIKGVGYRFIDGGDGSGIARDLDAIVRTGANTIRMYAPPPPALMDEAAMRGLRVIVGVPWPPDALFADDRAAIRSLRAELRTLVHRLSLHPATLLFAIGNDIPQGVVRWYGRRRIERVLRELFETGKAAAPEALFTYVNAPQTEHLEMPFFDVHGFKVSVHPGADVRAYVTRLHHAAGPRPLLLADISADSRQHGEAGQATLVARYLEAAFYEGACGAIVATWADRALADDTSGPDLGIVDAAHRPKPAYHAVGDVFRSAPFRPELRREWPRVSVIVCAYNATATIDECLTALAASTYPDFETIVVDDGSTDGTGAIAAGHRDVRVITIANCGLGAARNVGLNHASGTIVAYVDADVRVDPDWLTYLVQPFLVSDVMATGGPNVIPPDDSWFAQCVARAPGSPTHVLLNGRLAEHVPGCNCAFRADALRAIGGFSAVFARAGDDVDVCWRLQASGWTIAFAPAALVWHRHRPTLRAYWRQQVGYGEGETWLLQAHPDKFVRGRIAWRGRIHSGIPFVQSLSALSVNAGPFGTAPFPSVYRTDAHPLTYLPHSGRWQIAWLLVLGLAAYPASYGNRFAAAAAVAAIAALAVTLIKCLHYGFRSDVAGIRAVGRLSTLASRTLCRLTIAALHAVQPFARLCGRVRGAIARPSFGRVLDRRREAFDVRGRGTTFARAVRFCVAGRAEQTFACDRRIDLHAFLHATADRLRGNRVARRLQLDTGWWEDRDLTIDRGWLRVDVRTLVEDRNGRSVCRMAMRSRVTAAAVLSAVVGIMAVLVLDHGDVLAWRWGAAVLGVFAGALTAADRGRAWSAVTNAAGSVAAEFGMASVDTRANDQARDAKTRAVAVANG
jgi:GT2 family glycosyltransferase